MNYALIQNGVVANMIVIAPYNTSDFPDAVPVGDKPVGIGDEYRDGKFWRDGQEVLSPAEAKLAGLHEYYASTQAALPPQELEDAMKIFEQPKRFQEGGGELC